MWSEYDLIEVDISLIVNTNTDVVSCGNMRKITCSVWRIRPFILIWNQGLDSHESSAIKL